MKRVVLVGENPNLILYHPQDVKSASREPLFAASYWKVSWSEVGPGEVLVLAMNEELTPVGFPPTLILADNRLLGRFIASHFVDHFSEFDTRNVAAAPVRSAYLSMRLDASLAEVFVSANGLQTTLTWRGMRSPEPFSLNQKFGRHVYGTSLILIPCNQGNVVVNGRESSGLPRHADSGFGPSSVFLSLAEVWTLEDGDEL